LLCRYGLLRMCRFSGRAIIFEDTWEWKRRHEYSSAISCCLGLVRHRVHWGIRK
jgi:hypothetical protein